MGVTDTYSKVIEIVAETLDIDIEDLSEDTQFADLSVDSFDLLEMISVIEDEFNVEVSDASMDEFRTIGDIVEALED